jgi:site-specific DNA-cytosine methylase
MTKLFIALTLFSGGGGADIGIKLAGGDIRAAIDFSPWAARTYQANDPTTAFVQCDVRDSSQSDRAASDLLRSVGIGPGSLGYVHASPPCQLFSRGNSRGIGETNRISVHSGVLQSSAATLPLDVARFVHQCRPMTGTMECDRSHNSVSHLLRTNSRCDPILRRHTILLLSLQDSSGR